MSDLRYQSDEELLRRLKADRAALTRACDEVQRLERELGHAKVLANGIRQRLYWTAHYLAGGTPDNYEG